MGIASKTRNTTSTQEPEDALRLELEAAAYDPLFLADIEEIEEAFRSADKQTAARLDNAWTDLPTTSHA